MTYCDAEMGCAQRRSVYMMFFRTRRLSAVCRNALVAPPEGSLYCERGLTEQTGSAKVAVRTMEGQSCAATATSQLVSVDEMSSSGDSTATQVSDSGTECCSWTSPAGGDKKGAETDNNGATTSEGTLGNQSVTALSTDAHNHTTIVECNPSFIPEEDLTQTTSCTKNSFRNSPERGTEAQKEGNLDLHLQDAEEVGGNFLLPVTTNDKLMSEDGKEEEKSLEVERNATQEQEGPVQTPHKLLKASFTYPSGLRQPISLDMLITDRKKQGRAMKEAESIPFEKETNAVIGAGTTELSENQTVKQVISWDTKILQSHNKEHTLSHTLNSKRHHDGREKSESIPDHTAGEGKDNVSELIIVEPARKSVGLTADKNMENTCKMHLKPLDLSNTNEVERTGILFREQTMPEVTDNSGEDVLVPNMANSEENLMEEDAELADENNSIPIDVTSCTLHEMKILEEDMPEMENCESPLDKSQACPKVVDLSCDQREEDLQPEQLSDSKWKHSFTCNICSFTAFSVKDIQNHCAKCEEVNSECMSVDTCSVPQITDSPQCNALKEGCHVEVLSDKIGPTDCDLSNPDAQSMSVMLSQEGSNAVNDESAGPLQQRVLASTDNAGGKRSVRGKKKSPRNICQGEDPTMAGWKAIIVHPTQGKVRTRTFWRCPDCPYKTDKIYPSIKEHGARHVVSEKFPCDVCTYSCPTEIGIRSHRRMHKKDRNQKSRKKDKAEVQVLARQLRRRLRRNKRVYRCSRCSFSTLVLASFEKHCKKHTRKVAKRHTQRKNVATIGECTTIANDLKNEQKDECVHETNEANSCDSQTYKVPATSLMANKKLEVRDIEKCNDKSSQRELEVLSETSGSSFTNQSFNEGNTISPPQRAKTKKYSCIKCSFSCNSWLSVKAHMAVHKKGVTNTAMEIESCTDEEEQANKLEERDANDKITCVIVDPHNGSPPDTPTRPKRKMYRCTTCPFKCDRIGWLISHMKHHELSQKFSCEFCSFSTSHKIALINHQGIHSPDSKKGTARTPIGTTATDECNKTESGTKVAEQQQLLYRCKECPYTADEASILERHEKCHVIWRWHKRMREMSQAGEQAEATVASGCNDSSNGGNPADVTNKEINTEDSGGNMDKPREMYTCDECTFKTDFFCTLEQHKTSHGASKHTNNNSTFASVLETSELHHGVHEKVHDDQTGNADVALEDLEAEKDENETGHNTDITVEKEDEEEGRQTSLMSRMMVDEYKYIFHCEECPFRTDWLHDLEKHKSGHNSEAEFPCDKCSFSAATKGAIEVHHRVHRYKNANREAKLCTECGFSTHSYESLQLHMQTHGGVSLQADVGESVTSPLPCSDVQTPSTSSLEGSSFRRKMEEYLYIFNCEQCPFKTDWYHELEKHRMGHNADLEYPCDHCTFSSSTKKAVEVHKRVHKDGSALKMDRSAASKSTARISEEETDKQERKLLRFPHMTPSGMRYYNHKCPECPFRTDSKKKVGVHLLHHRTKAKYNCDICTYSTNYQSALGVHRRIHLQGYTNPHAGNVTPIKDTPHGDVKNESKRLSPQKCQKCTKCPYKTDSRKKMDVHMVFHRRRGKYKCNLCSYSSDRMTTLGPHRRVHLQNQEVSDSAVQNMYKVVGVVQPPLAAYKTDPRSDSGQKYSCNACPSKFNSLLGVRDHVSHHLKQFLYSCPECTYSADSKRSIKSHKGVHERHQEKECRHDAQTSNDLTAQSAEEDEMQGKSMIKKRKYQCEHCPYSTDKLHRSSAHASNHGANHLNKCSLCSYSTNASIKVHMRIHKKYAIAKTKGQKVDTAGSILTVEKVGGARDSWQYKCSQCPYLAKTASYIRSHQRYHCADLPLKCPECTFSCSRLQQLSFHLEWHGKSQDKKESDLQEKQKQTRGRIGSLQRKIYEQGFKRVLINGQRHYICPHCPFRSRWTDQAAAHLEHHFVMYSYKCAHCSYSTRTKDKVKFHMKLHKKAARDGNSHSTDGEKRTVQMENEDASNPSEARLPKGPRTRARLGVIGQSPIKHTASQVPVPPASSSVSRNLSDFSGPNGSESTFIRYMTPSCSKEEPEQEQQVTVLTFVCMYCDRPFTDQESWLAHMKRHRL
ncbi:hypothetical protein Bbelb_421560 [Branchiostoma belcheri]|nr:hypothetical protein Bbelb_421560 [Branchiostoma belcheri]